MIGFSPEHSRAPVGREAQTYTGNDYIVPKVYLERVPNLHETNTGLKDGTFMGGSTHSKAQWRFDAEFLRGLGEAAPNAFNPQVSDWDPSYAALEARAVRELTVQMIRLENKDLVNGSLGSIAEIFAMLLSSILRGQKMIISVETNFAESLKGLPRASAQFQELNTLLAAFKDKHPENIVIHNGNNLFELGTLVREISKEQKEKPLAPFDLESFYEKRDARRQKQTRSAVITGSGKAYSPYHQSELINKRGQLAEAMRASGLATWDLSSGPLSEGFQQVYDTDEAGRAYWLEYEKGQKFEADAIVSYIQRVSLTNAGIGAFAGLVINALHTGQDVYGLFEAFSVDDYLNRKLADANVQTDTFDIFKTSFTRSGLWPESRLAELDSTNEAGQTGWQRLHEALRSPNGIYKKIKSSKLLFPLWNDADDTQRVHGLAKAHLGEVMKDFPHVFTMADSLEDLQAKMGERNSTSAPREAEPKSVQFVLDYARVRQNLEELLAPLPEELKVSELRIQNRNNKPHLIIHWRNADNSVNRVLSVLPSLEPKVFPGQEQISTQPLYLVDTGIIRSQIEDAKLGYFWDEE